MFTGIITHRGTISRMVRKGDNARLVIDAPSDFMALVGRGDSIACSGICLTAVDLTAKSFGVDVSLETLRRTTLGERKTGDLLNLEGSLRLGDKLGGHLVMGHVDGIGTLVTRVTHGESVMMRFSLPIELAPLVAHKGCVAVDGISLTPTDVTRETFDVWVIPETLRRTSLGDIAVGGKVNLEADLLSRYVARQLGFGQTAITEASLLAAGWGVEGSTGA
jgi:riboflavin synthase